MIDLTTWNLSVPTSPSATTIATARLNNNYSSQYFYKTKDGGVSFWAPVTGGTTDNSGYPRSELRETQSDGTLLNWRYTDGHNMLSAAVAVNKVPSTYKIVIGQIHCINTSSAKGNPLVKLQYNYKNKHIEGLIRSKPSDSSVSTVTLATSIALNERFTYSLHLAPSGTLSINVKNSKKHWQYTKQVSSTWANRYLYFKAGDYVQDNSGKSTEGGKVTFYALETVHK